MRKPFNRITANGLVVTCLLAVIVVAVCVVGIDLLRRSNVDEPSGEVVTHGHVNLWWDPVPASVRETSLVTGTLNNVDPDTYVGADACRKCHPQNYEDWSQHPHRWMNALASETSVKGDFSGETTMNYLGGEVTFFREGDEYRMRLVRERIDRVYRVTQTIGWRFFQYYVGRQIEGPESTSHKFYEEDHVLPFGYWLDENEWVPVVHIGDENRIPDGFRPDPFDPPIESPLYANYALACNRCHDTFAIGDELLRKPVQLGSYSPVPLHLSVLDYISAAHPGLGVTNPSSKLPEEEIRRLSADIERLEGPEHAITLGIGCEACHLGGRDHAEGMLKRPHFIPGSPKLFVQTDGHEIDLGRSQANVNFVCGRCHSGGRPTFAAGMATWNSTESKDAMRGACYSQLTCVNCHNPHRATGPKWSLTPDQDDALCLKCHQKYESASARRDHTHHPTGSSGARCMNCHMPRINEGLQDMVRTHMIFSPNRNDMIEANHPNACNMCHTTEPIDWTIKHLREWYGTTYSDQQIAANYPERAIPVALGWLKQNDEAVRLVAADALVRTQAKWALPELLDTLDDPYLINRQFGQKGLESLLGIDLSTFGYRFYMTPEERKEPLERLRKSVDENKR